jgi:hypothetical protein
MSSAKRFTISDENRRALCQWLRKPDRVARRTGRLRRASGVPVLIARLAEHGFNLTAIAA